MATMAALQISVRANTVAFRVVLAVTAWALQKPTLIRRWLARLASPAAVVRLTMELGSRHRGVRWLHFGAALRRVLAGSS